jgi:hypothetical protein
MSTEVTCGNIQLFIGFFEEPEPGVPDGCTGWYHSGGKFPVQTAKQVFSLSVGSRSQFCDNVAGPFTSKDEALTDLQAVLGS